jgi:dsDNA-binding SOS-regulon protein
MTAPAKATTKKGTKKMAVNVDTDLLPLLTLLLKRSNLKLEDLTNTAIASFLNENQDLLTKTERSQYKHLFL